MTDDQPTVRIPSTAKPVTEDDLAVQPGPEHQGAYIPPVVTPPPTPARPVRAPRGDARGRGLTDLGLFILRLTVGGTFLYHGLQKLTGWFGGPGLDGMKDSLAAGGWEQPQLAAIMVTVGEVAGGSMLILGLATPLAAGAVLAVIIDAWLMKQGARPGLQYGGQTGVEIESILIGASSAVLLAGPGRIGLDAGRGWATRPYIGSLLCFLAAIAAAVVTWIVLKGTNPLT